MFSRTISLVLIAALIACPLWCNVAFGSGQCCPTGESESVMVCGNEPADCCGEKKEAPLRAPHNDDRPCPCETAGCQGICGGAVLQKSVQLDWVTVVVLLPLIDEHASENLQLLDCCRHRLEQTPGGSGANHGRTVRTLHMSFLC